MTRLDVLKRLYEDAMNQVFANSDGWRMNKPKPGMEKMWNDSRDTASVLEELIKENGGSV